MTSLEFVNKFLFQWFFVRLTIVKNSKTNDKLYYALMGWITPLTGWSGNYKYINKRFLKKLF